MNMNKAYFAGGCFWCMVKPFDEYEGIDKVTSGYMGGTTENPTYEEVKTGETGHLEVVEIQYDVALFSYNRLLERSEEHTSELQSRFDLVCRLLLEKKKSTQSTQ